MPDGREGIDWVYADRRIDDPELERAVYGVGDRVPMADAIRYGVVDAPEEPAPGQRPKGQRPKGKRKPAEDRARKPSEDRA